MLDEDTQQLIERLARSGFYTPARICEIVGQEYHAPGDVDADEVRSAVETAFQQLTQEMASWPAVTDCDRLDAAFERIAARGVIALQNAGYTQSDGYEDIGYALKQHPSRAQVLGYCFYHGQDLERAVEGGGLYLAFGPIDPKREETLGVEVGNIVREELERQGLAVRWNGTFKQRIHLPSVVWQRRPR